MQDYREQLDILKDMLKDGVFDDFLNEHGIQSLKNEIMNIYSFQDITRIKISSPNDAYVNAIFNDKETLEIIKSNDKYLDCGSITFNINKKRYYIQSFCSTSYNMKHNNMLLLALTIEQENINHIVDPNNIKTIICR